MRVFELLERRRLQWRDLDALCSALETSRPSEFRGETLVRFAALYRAACADLALADAYQLPPETVEFLHKLVGRANHQLYRDQTQQGKSWLGRMFVDLPRTLFFDPYLRAAFAIFWGVFLAIFQLTLVQPEFARTICGDEQIDAMEEMYGHGLERGIQADFIHFGYYIMNNAGLGMQCFAFGLLGGVGGIFSLAYNALFIGSVFGYMANSPNAGTFFNFVTAHGPCELTAIVLSGAAGMRVGFALFNTRGLTRSAALRIAGAEALPIAGLATTLFLIAAFIEGFISPSELPLVYKGMVAVLTSMAITYYLVLLGIPEVRRAT